MARLHALTLAIACCLGPAAGLGAPLPSQPASHPAPEEILVDTDLDSLDGSPDSGQGALGSALRIIGGGEAVSQPATAPESRPQAAIQDRPTTYPITEVAFQGADGIDSSTLRELVHSRRGQAYDEDLIREDLKRLSTVARKAEARRLADGEGYQLIYVLSPNPSIGSIAITGNSRISTKRLLRRLPIKEDEVLSATGLAESREAILKEYRAIGHARAAVEIQTPERPEAVDVHMIIHEGQRLKVDDVKIIGATEKSKTFIRFAMATKGSWLFFGNHFDEEKFGQDLVRIAQGYLADGYFDADVRAGQFIYAKDGKSITPVIEITEGPQYSISAIDIEGATLFSDYELRSPFEKLIGKRFNAKDFARAREKMMALYANDGYMLADVAENYSFDRDAATAAITLEVTESPRVYVGEVRIAHKTLPADPEASIISRLYNRISPPVKDETVMRRVRLHSGGVYRKNLEAETVMRLEDMGIFETVRARSLPTSDETVRDLLIELEEGDSGRLDAGVLFAEETGASVYGSFTERNLFGEARDLSIYGLVGTRAMAGSANYHDPYWRGAGQSLDISVFRMHPYRRGYSQADTGVSVEAGLPLEDGVRRYIGARLAHVAIQAHDDGLKDEIDSYVVAVAGQSLHYDTRDSARWPTSGILASAGIEGGYAGSGLFKLSASLATYHQLRENIIYALNLQGGIMPINAQEAGIDERFFMGGSDDLRGFALRGAGPMGGQSGDVPLGGASRLLIKNELRWTMLEDLGVRRRPLPVRGVIFLDAGTLAREPLEIGPLRASVGAGLRLGDTASIDFAVPMLSQDGDQTEYLHFKFSSSF